MATEIERKYLVRDDAWRKDADSGTPYRQGYIVGAKQASVRVRIEGDKAYLNIKSATLGITRREFEYLIPLADAEQMLNELCEKPLIEKTRFHIRVAGHLWEIDVFAGENTGLIVAEVELQSEAERPELPPWVGQEVSDDPRYYNVCLVKHPYSSWS